MAHAFPQDKATIRFARMSAEEILIIDLGDGAVIHVGPDRVWIDEGSVPADDLTRFRRLVQPLTREDFDHGDEEAPDPLENDRPGF